MLLYDIPWPLQSSDIRSIWGYNTALFIVNEMMVSDQTRKERATWICKLLIGEVDTHVLLIQANVVRALIHGLTDSNLMVRGFCLEAIRDLCSNNADVPYILLKNGITEDIVDTTAGFVFQEDWDYTSVGIKALENILNAECEHGSKQVVMTQLITICGSVFDLIGPTYGWSVRASAFEKADLLNVLDQSASCLAFITLNEDGFIHPCLKEMMKLIFVYEIKIWEWISISMSHGLCKLEADVVKDYITHILFTLRISNKIPLKTCVVDLLIKFCQSVDSTFDLNSIFSPMILSWICKDPYKVVKEDHGTRQQKKLYVLTCIRCVKELVAKGFKVSKRMQLYCLEVINAVDSVQSTADAVATLKAHWLRCTPPQQQHLLREGLFECVCSIITKNK